MGEVKVAIPRGYPGVVGKFVAVGLNP